MATVSTQQMPVSGSALTYSNASVAGDRFTPGSRSFLHIVNGSAVSITATIATPATPDGFTLPGRAVVIAAGANRMVPVTSEYFKSSDGLADITWTAITTITFAVIQN